jgi:hypothetical protein
MLLQFNTAQPHVPSGATRERGRRHQSRQYHQHRIPGQLMLIMKLGPLPGRNETEIPLRQNALDPGFHDVLAGPAHPDRNANGAGVT